MTSDNNNLFTMRMDKELRGKLDILAKEDCCTLASVIRKACIRYIKERGY